MADSEAFFDAVETPVSTPYEVQFDALFYLIDASHPQLKLIIEAVTAGISEKIWHTDGQDLLGAAVFNCADGSIRLLTAMTSLDLEKVRTAQSWSEISFGTGQTASETLLEFLNDQMVTPESPKYVKRLLVFSENHEISDLPVSPSFLCGDVRQWVLDRVLPTRAAANVTFSFANAVSGPFKIYSCVVPAQKPKFAPMGGEPLELLRTALEWRSEETGAKVDGEVVSFLEIQNRKFVFEPELVKDTSDRTTVQYLGSLEADQVRISDSVGPAYFVRPGDSPVSEALAAALLDVLAAEKKKAIFLFRGRKFALESLPDRGLFLTPLAFVEEFRNLKFRGESADSLTEEEFRTHLELATEIVRDFQVSNFHVMHNPTIQFARRTLLEKLQLVSDEAPEISDRCQPSRSRVMAAANHCREWSERLALLGAGGPSAWPGSYKKPKLGRANENAPASASQPVEPPSLDEMRYYVAEGRVNNLKMPELRAFLKTRLNVGDSGNKSELVDRVLRAMSRLDSSSA